MTPIHFQPIPEGCFDTEASRDEAMFRHQSEAVRKTLCNIAGSYTRHGMMPEGEAVARVISGAVDYIIEALKDHPQGIQLAMELGIKLPLEVAGFPVRDAVITGTSGARK